MRNEIDNLIASLQSIMNDEPWYGRAVMNVLQDVDTSTVYKKPNDNSHSLIDLLYHMITWAEFTLNRLEKKEEKNMAAFEAMDWRVINPDDHTWEKGLAQLKVTHDLIVDVLGTKDDEFLSGEVEYREYNFRVLLNGIIQHDIYHIGQIAYLKKFWEGENK